MLWGQFHCLETGEETLQTQLPIPHTLFLESHGFRSLAALLDWSLVRVVAAAGHSTFPTSYSPASGFYLPSLLCSGSFQAQRTGHVGHALHVAGKKQ